MCRINDVHRPNGSRNECSGKDTGPDPDGRRHSLDVHDDSTYDAAHLYVVEAKKERAVGMPR
jgi:hypothetical protein